MRISHLIAGAVAALSLSAPALAQSGPQAAQGAVGPNVVAIVGGRVLTGGARHELGGRFFQPTVTLGGDDRLFREEETFGPMIPVFAFDNEDEVLEKANASDFGLASYLFTRDLDRAIRIGRRIEAGMCGVNTGLISNEVAPFGGVKASGLGREGSKYGIEDYLEIKYMCLGGI